ncbi:MAG: hypothetical protein SNJ52_01660 [Verrucomicrobiia bacterium]
MRTLSKSIKDRVRRSPEEWMRSIDERCDQLAHRLLPPAIYKWITWATLSFRPAQTSGPARYTPRPLEIGAANHFLARMIRAGMPLMVTRFGAYELAACSYYLRRIMGQNNAGTHVDLPDKVAGPLYINAGVFPRSPEIAIRCVERYRQDVALADALAVWYRPDEHVIWEQWCPDALPISFDSLTPLDAPEPWTYELAGKRVLVIHPFAQSIRAQYLCFRKWNF